jgi:hypothetical protein
MWYQNYTKNINGGARRPQKLNVKTKPYAIYVCNAYIVNSAYLIKIIKRVDVD